MKQCIKCGEILDESLFYIHPKTGNPRNICKQCFQKRVKYTQNCKVTVNTLKISKYFQEYKTVYNYFFTTPFRYRDVKKVFPWYTLKLNNKLIKGKLVNKVTDKSPCYYKFSTQFIDYIENNTTCSKKLQKHL